MNNSEEPKPLDTSLLKFDKVKFNDIDIDKSMADKVMKELVKILNSTNKKMDLSKVMFYDILNKIKQEENLINEHNLQ